MLIIRYIYEKKLNIFFYIKISLCERVFTQLTFNSSKPLNATLSHLNMKHSQSINSSFLPPPFSPTSPVPRSRRNGRTIRQCAQFWPRDGDVIDVSVVTPARIIQRPKRRDLDAAIARVVRLSLAGAAGHDSVFYPAHRLLPAEDIRTIFDQMPLGRTRVQTRLCNTVAIRMQMGDCKSCACSNRLCKCSDSGRKFMEFVRNSGRSNQRFCVLGF